MQLPTLEQWLFFSAVMMLIVMLIILWVFVYIPYKEELKQQRNEANQREITNKLIRDAFKEDKAMRGDLGYSDTR